MPLSSTVTVTQVFTYDVILIVSCTVTTSRCWEGRTNTVGKNVGNKNLATSSSKFVQSTSTSNMPLSIDDMLFDCSTALMMQGCRPIRFVRVLLTLLIPYDVICKR